jgi:carbon storage regulator
MPTEKSLECLAPSGKIILRRTFQGGTSMLVLSRKLGERIVVPHCEVTVTVLEVKGNAVRLGIAAPSDVPVYREEVWRKLNQPSPSAAGSEE